jgi:glycerophosphoryl diester phosphodiesterase
MLQPVAARAAAILLAAVALAAQAPRAELVGFAVLPPDTFADGPPSGHARSPGRADAPFPGQPVQGFSSIRPDLGRPGWWLALCDNGYGTKANSADFLLRIYPLRPDWRAGAGGGQGGVEVGAPIQLADPDRQVPFRIELGQSAGRPLTGADFDPESLVQMPDGSFWIGDEFGPYLLHAAATGRLLAPPFEAPGLRSPDNPSVPVQDSGLPAAAPVRRSRGFEGLALDAGGTRLIGLLEAAPAGDAPGTTRLLEFDLASTRFTGRSWSYRTTVAGASATELVAYAPGRFLAIERDDAAGREARVKRVVALRLGEPGAPVETAVVADLLDIADPQNLAGFGPAFTFPFITPEAVWPEDGRTLVLVNDNNYPGGGARGPAGSKDASEFIRLRLARALPR